MALTYNSVKSQVSKIAIAALILGGTINSAQAVQLANGKVFFESVPRLEEAYTTFNSTNFRGAIYYFEVSIPEDAGEPLKKIHIRQQEGFDTVYFNLKRTRATLERRRRGPEVAIESVEAAEDDSITVTFQEAIAPGNTVHLAMRPFYNPDTGGVYLFGVTALPDGEDVHPQFLGYGRLHFFEGSGFFGSRFGKGRSLFGW